MARPKKENQKDKHDFLHMRITEEQAEALKKRAKELGIPVSGYIRLCFQKELREKFL